MQYIFEKYGRDRAAIVATVTHQHIKGALKDVGKAMGLSVDTIEGLTSNVWGYEDLWFDKHAVKQQGLNKQDKHLQKVLELTREYIGFPRQLGQHTGGFVITKGKLSDLCPILNARMEARTCIEWNKDDIDALGFMKIDVLALGMLTCIRKAFELCKQHYGLDLTLSNIPQDDPKVYESITAADTIGVFQIESRAQQSMLPRLRPKDFYDLVIEVAIVRPGPIQGDMVHPYLRRRNGEEPVEYPSKELEEILGRTLGVPLFQEQAMKIAIVAAGFTPAEADALRRSMATFKLNGLVSQFEKKLIDGMKNNSYTEEYAKRVFRQLEGFGSYGFPESHAASFALLVYVSAWIKTYYSDVFACALLNSMPMGFYQPAQIIIDAKKHGVVVRAIDINHSYWDNVLEEKDGQYCALRLGFRQIKGMRQEDMELLVANRHPAYTGIHELRNIGLSEAALLKLAEADAFLSIGLDRRAALWKVSTKDTPVSLYKGQAAPEEKTEQVALPLMSDSEHVVQDYASTSLSVKAHPVSFIREKLTQLHITSNKDLATKKNGEFIKVAGIVLVRQRPGTAKGVCFMTIEDETGWANAVIFANLFDKQRKEILGSTLIMLEGTLQIEGKVVHVIVNKCYDISKLLKHLTPSQQSLNNVSTFGFPDKLPESTNGKEKMVIPDARNFK
jgi:error-prone DNA polymerase